MNVLGHSAHEPCVRVGTIAGPSRVRAGAIAALGVLLLGAGPAAADLRLCNSTSSRVGVALGYQDAKGWVTEGWWNISSNSCETLLRGAVPSQFIYVYAIDYDRGGEWAGNSMMCTSEKTFLIRDVRDCQRRGHRSTGFFEVDTGQAKDWTIRLTDPDRLQPAR